MTPRVALQPDGNGQSSNRSRSCPETALFRTLEILKNFLKVHNLKKPNRDGKRLAWILGISSKFRNLGYTVNGRPSFTRAKHCG